MTRKIKIFIDTSWQDLEESVNKFTMYHNVVDIQYQMCPTAGWAATTKSVMIVYEED